MYFVIYDLDDNLICYIDTLEELIDYTSLRKRYVVRQFRTREYINYVVNDTYYKIYKFSY